MTRTRKSLLAVSAALLAGAFALVWLARLARIDEQGMPNALDFGVVEQRAAVEFDVRLLTSARDTPLEQAYAALVAKLPESLAGAMAPLDPKKLRGPVTVVDTKQLRPKVAAPDFLRLVSANAEQVTNWYQGRPFVVANFEVDTSKTGVFGGEIRGSIGRRQARLPVRIQVRPASSVPRTLVVSPFDGSATESGADFRPAVELFSEMPGPVDYRQRLPEDLAPYRVLLLAETVLAGLADEQAASLQGALQRGARVVLACNYFYRGTVAGANKVCAPHGLEVLDDEARGEERATRIEADPLTAGITNLSFHRGSPIRLAGPSARPLVWVGTNCYAAAAKTAANGEIVVVTQSLWWHWMHREERYGSNSHARAFLRNALAVP